MLIGCPRTASDESVVKLLSPRGDVYGDGPAKRHDLARDTQPSRRQPISQKRGLTSLHGSEGGPVRLRLRFLYLVSETDRSCGIPNCTFLSIPTVREPEESVGTLTHNGGDALTSSRYRQNPFARRIWRGEWHSGSKSAGLPTSTHRALAREVATLNRCGSYKKSMPLGASSGLDEVIE